MPFYSMNNLLNFCQKCSYGNFALYNYTSARIELQPFELEGKLSRGNKVRNIYNIIKLYIKIVVIF